MLRSHPQRSTSRRSASLALVVALTALVAVAHAQPKPDPANPDVLVAYKLEVEQGTSAFRAGMFNDARVSFERAYALYPEPVLLFNIASCYRRANDLENAIGAYRRFLDAAPGDDHRVTLATQTIASLEKELAAAEADDDIEVQVSDGSDDPEDGDAPILRLSGDSTFTVPGAPLSVTSALDASASVAAAGAPPQRRSRLRTYGLGIASVGAVVLLGAAVDTYRAYTISDDLGALPRDHQWNHDDAERYRDGESFASRARILALSGVALTATGTTLFVIGKRRDASAPRIEPAVGPGGAQVTLRGRF
ncbi:MAG TPA: tetratricopeptide repeat protein [Kofleriaceae bacterium]|nr:tetratricopeptide repeat protein [Kofleriaceae bacterium]